MLSEHPIFLTARDRQAGTSCSSTECIMQRSEIGLSLGGSSCFHLPSVMSTLTPSLFLPPSVFLSHSQISLSLSTCPTAQYFICPLSAVLPHYRGASPHLCCQHDYEAVMNSVIDLSLICASVAFKLFPVTSVSSMYTVESRHNGFYFIEVLLFSFFTVHLFSSYSSNLSSDSDWSRNV